MNELELRPDDPRLKTVDQYGCLVYRAAVCAYCRTQYLCQRHGVPARGWLLGATRGKQQAWDGWFCSKRCVRHWLERREDEQVVEVEVMVW